MNKKDICILYENIPFGYETTVLIHKRLAFRTATSSRESFDREMNININEMLYNRN